jgi:hypothetical protein
MHLVQKSEKWLMSTYFGIRGKNEGSEVHDYPFGTVLHEFHTLYFIQNVRKK